MKALSLPSFVYLRQVLLVRNKIFHKEKEKEMDAWREREGKAGSRRKSEKPSIFRLILFPI